MKPTDIAVHLRRMTWPEPSPGLRDRIVSGAAVIERPVVWSDQIWFSRAWRWSAAAFVCAVIAIGQWPDAVASDRADPSPQAVAAALVVEETAREAGLPAEAAARLAQRASTASSRPALWARDAAADAVFEKSGGLR